MEQATEQQATTQEQAAAPKKERKPRQPKKLTRGNLLLQLWNEGKRDAQEIATIFEAKAKSGEMITKAGAQKIEGNASMYLAQVEWYFAQLKKEGKIEGELITPFKERKKRAASAKKEAGEAAASKADANEAAPQATVSQAAPAAVEEMPGTL